LGRNRERIPPLFAHSRLSGKLRAVKNEVIDQRKRIGQQGEALAASYLTEQGYNIVQRNWRCPLGELDIVAEAGGTLIFVEVRTRRSHRFGLAEESLTPTKQNRLVDLAQTYLQESATPDQSWRIDVVTVQWKAGRPKINHVENAVGW
jgi:putative endonuclease